MHICKGIDMTDTDRMKFDDTDFKLTKLVGAGVAIGALVITIINPLVSWANRKPLVATLDGVAEGAIDGGRPGVTLTHGSTVTAQFADAGASLWLAALAPSILFVACLGGVLWLLWQLLDAVHYGHPFTESNVRRMRGIALIIVVGSFAVFLAQGLSGGYLLTQAVEGTSVFFANDTETSDLLIPGFGFLIAALAEAFRHGVELEGDVEGLI